MDAKVTISRDSKGKIKIKLLDTLSFVEFVELYMDPKDFAMAITGLAFRPAKMEVRGFEFVGKKKIIEDRSIVCPLKNLSRRELEVWLMENAQEDGWIVDSYVGSQKSIVYKSNGEMILNYTVVKFVDPVVEDE